METVEQYFQKKFRNFVFYGKLSNICSTQREIIRFSTPGVIAVNFRWLLENNCENIRGVNRFCTDS